MTINQLPALPSARRLQVPCLCGCGRLCGKRFAPGHDAKLLAWTLHVESGAIKEALAPHTHAVAVEVALRVAAGLSGSHTKVMLTRADLNALVAGEIPMVA